MMGKARGGGEYENEVCVEITVKSVCVCVCFLEPFGSTFSLCYDLTFFRKQKSNWST